MPLRIVPYLVWLSLATASQAQPEPYRCPEPVCAGSPFMVLERAQVAHRYLCVHPRFYGRGGPSCGIPYSSLDADREWLLRYIQGDLDRLPRSPSNVRSSRHHSRVCRLLR